MYQISRTKGKKGNKTTFGEMSETENGETVRSKAEKQVADYFFEQEIEYIYEQTIELSDGNKIKYDFYLPKYDIYVEYWGLENAGEVGEQYRERKEEKIELYNKHKLKLLSIYPEDLSNLEDTIPQRIKKLEKKYSGISAKFGEKLKSGLFGIREKDNDIGSSKMFCTHCGAEKLSYDEFCVECGKQD